jgi:hypothetical protein
MLPVNCGSHADYQNFVVTNLRKYYPDPNALARSTWDIIERFWNLDLSFTDTFMADKYSKFGPAPRTPSCMQRSYLLSIDFKVTSLTEWAAQLKMNPLYAILSGFEPGNTPGVGTFYDFINRLWDSDDDHMSPHIHPLKTKVKKPKTKGTKADSVEKVTVADLLPVLEHTDFKLDEQPYSSLFAIYQKEFLDVSVSTGLIHSDALALAGDGTPVVTSHRERKKRICKCKENGITDCKCDRYFSQPDCDIGWDSSRDCYYHGYDLYMLVDSQSDLPVFPHFCCASKHDSHGFLHAFFRMKFKCPKISHKNGCISCTCETPCSDAKYGRTVHLVMKDNPRLFNNPPWSSKEWKLEYNARTSAERSNKREKIDFKLESGRHRSTKMWYCRLYHILMLQHLDAWDLPFESTLRKLILNVA